VTYDIDEIRIIGELRRTLREILAVIHSRLAK